ncbi:MAG TPA: group II intron reverse transcriptase/maturase [Candidatus Sulfotelmatobacter sp.]|nr:group II intron reverse transcriptase/maturase [Candidatus Sulfotelmatobacter sp.]
MKNQGRVLVASGGRTGEQGPGKVIPVPERRYYSLIDKVYDLRNLYEAWKAVKRNKGAAGVDQVSVARFEKDLERNLRRLHQQLRDGTYKPPPVRRVYIDKADGSKRPLGIPAVADRVAQMATVRVLRPLFEAVFLPCSHGFRQGFSTRTAIAMVEEYRKQGFRWVVDVDFKSYFDTLNHEVLMAKVKERITDGRILGLIRSWLTAGVMSDGNLTYQTTGTPQGGVISPLLANIYLHSLDLALTKWGYKVVRYADDLVVLCPSSNKAKTALGLLKQVAEGELRLTLHPEKTRLTTFGRGFDFLGFTFKSRYRVARKRALEKFKDKVRELTPRHTHRKLPEVIADLNPVIRGWGNYFRLGHMKGRFETLDQWIRMRLRSMVLKRKAHRSRVASDVLPNQRLADLGLVSLLTL